MIEKTIISEKEEIDLLSIIGENLLHYRSEYKKLCIDSGRKVQNERYIDGYVAEYLASKVNHEQMPWNKPGRDFNNYELKQVSCIWSETYKKWKPNGDSVITHTGSYGSTYDASLLHEKSSSIIFIATHNSIIKDIYYFNGMEIYPELLRQFNAAAACYRRNKLYRIDPKIQIFDHHYGLNNIYFKVNNYFFNKVTSLSEKYGI